jgi:REP element-mobilizing transposase RayT
MQGCLFPEEKAKTLHGGEWSVGKRKGKRPLAFRRPMHFVLRSSLAGGPTSFLKKKNKDFIVSVLKTESRRSGVRIYEPSINSNHLHLATLGQSRTGYQRFLRVISAKIAQFITGAQKTTPLLSKFWDFYSFFPPLRVGKGFRVFKKIHSTK